MDKISVGLLVKINLKWSSLMKVRDVMTREFLTINELTTVVSAIKIMGDHNLNSLIIEPLDKKDSYGIVTEIDILYKVVARGHDPEKLYVRDIMTKPCIEVKPNTSVQSAAQLFAKTGICSAPIVQKRLFGSKQLLGVISVRNLISKSSFVGQPEQIENEINNNSQKAAPDFRQRQTAEMLENKLKDYQRLRSQGSISTYSTRIFDKMPSETSALDPNDFVEQSEPIKPEPTKSDSKKETSNPRSKKPFQAPEEQLTDYQRLRAQGSISSYSTRIFDKMPKDQTETDEES